MAKHTEKLRMVAKRVVWFKQPDETLRGPKLLPSHLMTYGTLKDIFGRAAGDSMLQACAEITKNNTRVSDMCGHLGGEQFILVHLPC